MDIHHLVGVSVSWSSETKFIIAKPAQLFSFFECYLSLSLSLSQIGLRNNQGMHTDVDSHNNVPGHKLVDQGFFFLAI